VNVGFDVITMATFSNFHSEGEYRRRNQPISQPEEETF